MILFKGKSKREAAKSGKAGELAVKEILRKLPREYIIFNDVLLKTKNGSNQIDHVVISPYGIFVIETKNHKGFILGKDNDRVWTQMLYNRPNYTMYNQVLQNESHIRHLSQALNIQMSYFVSSVVFTNDNVDLSRVFSSYAVHKRDLLNVIFRFRRKILSLQDIKYLSDSLNKLDRSSIYGNYKHKKYVQSLKK